MHLRLLILHTFVFSLLKHFTVLMYTIPKTGFFRRIPLYNFYMNEWYATELVGPGIESICENLFFIVCLSKLSISIVYDCVGCFFLCYSKPGSCLHP